MPPPSGRCAEDSWHVCGAAEIALKLSGGQKQRVAVAGIIAMRPLCIVLDEPTAMLDPSGRREVLDTVKKLNKEEGITILLITHYMDEAVQADRVVVMDDGVIRLDGTPGQFCPCGGAESPGPRCAPGNGTGGSAGLCRARSFEHCGMRGCIDFQLGGTKTWLY